MDLKSIIILLVLLPGLGPEAYAQYQKMSKASSVNLSGFSSHINIGWTRQLDNRNNLTLSGFYFTDDSEAIATDNFGVDASMSRWFWRLGNAYVSGGSGLFLNHTNASSPAGGQAGDLSMGISIRAELEYYTSWWLIFFGRANQMLFLSSDFFNTKFILSWGAKVVF